MVEAELLDIDPDGVEAEPVEEAESNATLIALLALEEGDVSGWLEDEAIAKIGSEVCENYERDKQSRADWEKVAEKALEDMTRPDWGAKDYPWAGASNVHYPLLPYAAMQFNARAYPAIVKGDEAVSCKVVGADKGQPKVEMTPQGPQPMMQPGPDGQPVPVWHRAPGVKTKRAKRVAEYMNTTIFYRMDDWEAETDALLLQLAVIGCEFRKVWFDGEKHQSRYVPAMNLIVNNDAKSLRDAPQITEEIIGTYPHQIARSIAKGDYRHIDIDPEERDARLLIEQQCHIDVDEDGVPEPYIVTVDHKTKQVLRIVPDFGPDDVVLKEDGSLGYIERRQFYTKYEFLPHPEGKFYNLGLAHLLDQHGEVINTIINQMIDANHAAVAGGGFIGSGLRIQGQGQSSTLRFRPGEYKTIPGASGNDIRSGIVERTYPQLSPVMFNLLDLILGAARDVASIKDVLTGEGNNTGHVGTTLAMIEQGLQVFTAIYKRIYRGLKGEFSLLFKNISQFATEETAKDYYELLDDMEADFEADFNADDMDIRPISDPAAVTKMQKMARAQFLMGTINEVAAVGGDAREIMRRAYEAADIDDIDAILPIPQPNPLAEMAGQLELAEKQEDIANKQAKTREILVSAQKKLAEIEEMAERLGLDQADLAVEVANTKLRAFEAGQNAEN